MKHTLTTLSAALSALLLGLAAKAQAPFMSNVYDRQVTTLNGTWSAIIDPYDVGVQKKIFENRTASANEEFYEYSFEGGHKLSVPGDWNHQTDLLKYYEGTVWYARHFDAPAGNARKFLYFAGVSYRATVYLNGREIVRHEGGFTPFEVEVTDLLKEKDNFLCVAVNNTRTVDAIPAMSFDWWNYGGILRDVMLVQVPQNYIRYYTVKLDKERSDLLNLHVEMASEGIQEVTFEIPGLKLRKKFATSACGVLDQSLNVKKLRRWSPADPHLYDVTLSSADDKITEKIGFRNIATRGTQILLNGEPIFMKSISFHEEVAPEQRRACTPEDAQYLIGCAKDLGVNMIRLAHYPQNEHIVRLAECEGIILWEEIPLWQGIDFVNPATLNKALTYYKEMLYRDQNRCAVSFWGIANETKPAPERDAFLTKVLETAKSIDNTRLFTMADDVAYYIPEKGYFEVDDPFADKLDVLSVNKYMGWYAPWLIEPAKAAWKVFEGRPLIISEFGGEARFGQHGAGVACHEWSEEYQANLYRANLEMFSHIPNLAGISPWVLFDFRSPYRFHPVNQDDWNRKGVLSDKGQKKQAWYIMHEYYTGQKPSYKDPKAPIEDRVADLLARMTLQEKIMQLNQYTADRNDNINNIGETVSKIPATIGSLIYYGSDPVLRNAIQKHAVQESRLGIPVLFGFDAIHGFRTVAPIPLAQACSWNPALVSACCHDSAAETASAGIDWTFSPMVDVAHDPRWGRVAEGYGEDPYTASVFCQAAVKGYQGDDLSKPDNILACLKHYVGYGASEAGRDYVYTEISRQSLWDTYLPSFKAGVDAGALTVMSAFNNISGVPASANRYTMTEVLKERWGMKGFIISDWDAIAQLVNQGMAKDGREAARLAMNAGLDMDMVDNLYCQHLESLIQSGEVDMALVDDAVARILRVKFELGLFENPYTAQRLDSERFLQKAALDNARELAAESFVLLKNDGGVLPLRSAKKIALVGPMADNQLDMLGCWRGRGQAEDVVSIRSAMASEFPGSEIRYCMGCDFDGEDCSGFDKACELAQWADVVVLCIGEKAKWSGENTSRSVISLPAIQEDLLVSLKASGKPVVAVTASGRPIDLTRISAVSDAILHIWHPGVQAGPAVAGTLSGRYNPSGKLAMTFPFTQGQIPIYYNRRASGRRGTQGLYKDITSEPLYPFAYGLSYSNFEYGDITLSSRTVTRDGKITATVSVTNTSVMDGKETVHWFIRDVSSMLTRPVKELKFFEKRLIKAGATQTFVFEIDPMRDLAFVDGDGNPVLEAGEFEIMVADKKISITLQ